MERKIKDMERRIENLERRQSKIAKIVGKKMKDIRQREGLLLEYLRILDAGEGKEEDRYRKLEAIMEIEFDLDVPFDEFFANLEDNERMAGNGSISWQEVENMMRRFGIGLSDSRSLILRINSLGLFREICRLYAEDPFSPCEFNHMRVKS